MSAEPAPERVQLERALRAGARGIALVAADERRAIEVLEQVGDGLNWPVHTWSASAGIDAQGRPTALAQLLTELRSRDDDAIWILLDGAASLGGATERRALRELAQRDRGPAVVVLDPSGEFDGSRLPEFIPELVLEHFGPPQLLVLEDHLDWIVGELDHSGFEGARDRLGPHLPALARGALGLELSTLERLVAQAVLAHGIDAEAIGRDIARAKPAALDRHQLLTPVDPAHPDELGGLASFKRWVHRRALALQPRARAAGIPDPRGVLLLGVQGCGKSLAARACAHMLDVPLLRLDPGRLFGGTVGLSEENLRRALSAVDRVAPVVLWLDEIDKGLAGTEGSASDAGTAARVVGGLLTWLQERTRPVFVVATANRIDRLPPELLRRGRLDETFFIDLPDAPARETIAQIHLVSSPERRLGSVPPLADPIETFAATVRGREGFSGAEIEAAVIEARLDAYAEDRPLAARDFERALDTIVPLSVSHAESLTALRDWARTRARSAS